MFAANDKDPSRLDQSIMLLKHTSRMEQLFTDKHAIYNSNDTRLQDLSAMLQFFSDWKQQVQHGKEFLSSKLWFDMQSMVLGFISLVRTKLARFPGYVKKPAIMNQDLVENHFSQLRAANGQNDNPVFFLTQGNQNSIIFDHTTLSKKSNTGMSRNSSFAELPKENLFSKNKPTA